MLEAYGWLLEVSARSVPETAGAATFAPKMRGRSEKQRVVVRCISHAYSPKKFQNFHITTTKSARLAPLPHSGHETPFLTAAGTVSSER